MKKFFKRFSEYGFWVSLSGAVVLFVNSLGKIFGFSVENEIVDGLIMSIAGVLVVLGFVVKKNDKNNDDNQGDNSDIDKNVDE